MSTETYKAIVNKYKELFGREYRRNGGRKYRFIGILWGEDDLYYTMYNGKELVLLSCVLSIENYGYELQPLRAGE